MSTLTEAERKARLKQARRRGRHFAANVEFWKAEPIDQEARRCLDEARQHLERQREIARALVRKEGA